MNNLQERLKSLSPQQREALLARLRQQNLQQNQKGGVQTIPIRTASSKEFLPLSYAQQRLWFLDEMGSGSAYNMPIFLQVRGRLDVPILQAVLNEIVRRHESLRTNFAVNLSGESSPEGEATENEQEAGAPYQVIQPAAQLVVPVVDLSDLSPTQQAASVQEQTEREALRPFDLSKDLMLRAQVLKLATESNVLLLTMHHIASDGWSMGILVQELSALYAAFSQGEPSPLPELTIQYADFAVWQRRYLQGEVLEKQVKWWKEQLADAPALLQLPTDRPRPTQQSFRGSPVRGEIEATLTQRLHELSRRQGATLYMTLLAAFQILLHRYSGQDDIVVGSPIANRNRAELEPLIGFFVNTLALRSNLADNPSFLELLNHVQQTTQAAYDHQDLPFERLVEELHPERNLAYTPVVQVMFALQNAAMGDFELPGLRVSALEFAVQTTRVDLELHVREVGDSLQLYAVYSSDLFDASTIERLVAHYQELLKGIVANPAQAIATLPLLTEAERHQLLVEWNNTASDYPKDKTIHQLFEEQVERTPDAVAVVMAGEQGLETRGQRLSAVESPVPSLQSLTYAELNARANQLAHHLRSLGVAPDVLVGICVERSIEMVVGLLAILKAGGAYVPLDPKYPSDRLAFMLQDAAPSVIVTQRCYQQQLPASVPLVLVDADDRLFRQQPSHNPTRQPSATIPNRPGDELLSTNLAYVIYTSGSTGQPKGVLLEHRGLVNLAQAQLHAFGVQSGHRVLQMASLNFDASIWEIVMTLCAGATLIMASSEQLLPGSPLTHTLQTEAISHVTLVPSALALLDPTELPNLQTIIVAGEACPVALAARWVKTCHFFNAYGPTETTVCATIMDCTSWQNHQQAPPIGRPIANTQLYILDTQEQLLPMGVAGQLCVGGVGLARGYHNRPELTQAKFVPNPFGSGKLYKTGDLARWLPDGNIEYLGRIDQQVKLRGFRIELGEIEAVLSQHPDVHEAVVVVREEQANNQQLVAYLVVDGADAVVQSEHLTTWQSLYESSYSQATVQEELNLNLTGWNSSYTGQPIAKAEMVAETNIGKLHRTLIPQVRSFLQSKLPDYMIPNAFVLLDKFPLTPNGKIDRKALPAPIKLLRGMTNEVLPQNELERTIATVWQEELNMASVGIYDNFFDLGGHSLLLTRVHSRLKRLLAYPLKMVELFQYPTIHALSDYINQASKQFASATPETEKKSQLAARRRNTAANERQANEIAIIGMAGRFPAAASVADFWQNLCAGKEGIVFFSPEELVAAGVSAADRNDTHYVPAGGIVDGIEWFDAGFFGMSPREAEMIDPQHRLFLECAWESLEDAGYDPACYPGDIALYAGSSINTYLQHNLAMSTRGPSTGFYHAMLSNDKDFLTTRVSYKLNLRGPSVAVQTACSTSLVAVHQACQSLRNGECDLALAGGVSLHSPQKQGYLYQPGMIMSPDGHCRAFDAQAQGTVGGEGVGLVVLKRLAEAIADGDHIYAVIKGSAINNDGSEKVGYMAPSVNGQAAVIATAQADAGVDAATITYIETHGTGTPLGDPIEIAALKEVFAGTIKNKTHCAIGAVKTNIGHLGEAAGVAGLIKTVLALKHQQLPPTLHFRKPNPQLGLEETPFYVNTTLQPWHTTGGPRRAGVSSFGIGGTNAHVVLEEAPAITQSITVNPSAEAEDGKENRSHHLLTLSAKNAAALQALVQRYIDFLADEIQQPPPSLLFPEHVEGNGERAIDNITTPSSFRKDRGGVVGVADICYTSHIGRAHFDHRLSVTAQSKAALRQKLIEQQKSQSITGSMQGVVQGIGPAQGSSAPPLRIAFLFTGQGSQYPDMGRHLYQSQPVFRQTMDRCDEILRPLLGESILEVIYDLRFTIYEKDTLDETIVNPPQGKSKIVDDTLYAQPALFALEYSLASLWQAWGIQPAVVMGHSVGELVAACVAGVFSLEDGLKLIAARGRLMSELPETGEMITVLAEEDRVRSLLTHFNGQAEDLSIAALNGPQQVVLSGRTAALQTLTPILTAQGIQSRKLNVSHAFHSPLMEPMVDAFAEVARTITYHPPRIPIISNITGKLSTAPQASASMSTDSLSADSPFNWPYWVDHVRQPVRFADGIATLRAQPIDLFLEIGPKPTLISLARQCLEGETRRQRDKETRNEGGAYHLPLPHSPCLFLPSLRQGRSDWQQMLESLGELYMRGAKITWTEVDRGLDGQRSPRKVTLPTYPFQRQRYWVEPPVEQTQSSPSDPQTVLKEFVNQKNLDQLTHLLIETGLLPKMLEKLMAAYHPPFTSSQSQDQTGVISSNLGLSANDLPSPQQLLAPLTETHPTIPQQSVLSPVTPPIRQQPVDADGNTQHTRLTAWFQSMTAQMLGYPQDQLTANAVAGALGMDSLMVIELRSRIEQELGINLPIAVLLTASFEQLASLALEQLATKSPQIIPQAVAERIPSTPVIGKDNKWVRCFKPNPQAHLRLVCLPYAGGGASLYRPWAALLPDTIELCAIQLPGREDRLAESLPDEYAALLTVLVDALIPYLDKPLALYGHSMGGQMAYAVAQALRTTQGVEPRHLFIGAASAPQLERLHSYASRWELFAALEAQGGGATTVQTNPELAALARRIFDADMTLSKRYYYQADNPLTCPVTVFGGLDDPICSAEALRAWQTQTTGPFALHLLPGNHFFLQQETTALLAAISETLLTA